MSFGTWYQHRESRCWSRNSETGAGNRFQPTTREIANHTLSQYSNAGLLNDHQPALQRRSFTIMTLFYIPGPRVLMLERSSEWISRIPTPLLLEVPINPHPVNLSTTEPQQRVNKQFPEGVNCTEMLLWTGIPVAIDSTAHSFRWEV